MNHIYLIRLVALKRPGFQSQKYGMPKNRRLSKIYLWTCSLHCTLSYKVLTVKTLVKNQWRTQKIFMGGVSFSDICGHLYLVCTVFDVTIWWHSHVCKPTF